MNVSLTLVAGGTLLVLLSNFILHRALHFKAAQAAVISALLSLALLLPYSAMAWPGGDVFTLYFTCYLMVCYAYYVICSGGTRGFIKSDPSQHKGWHWAPVIIFSFFLLLTILFGSFIMIAEKGITLTTAQGHQVSSQFPGTVPYGFQKQEAYYNDYVERLHEQQKRGWQIDYGFEQPLINGKPNHLIVEPKDKTGAPLIKAVVTAQLVRLADKKQDMTLTFIEQEPGRYVAATTVTGVGRWDLVLHIRLDDLTHEIRANTLVANDE